jgi:prolyl-tRNA editing enzyme YbaK/EbsC (Cys-tRNA(Pro) deacylase)
MSLLAPRCFIFVFVPMVSKLLRDIFVFLINTLSDYAYFLRVSISEELRLLQSSMSSFIFCYNKTMKIGTLDFEPIEACRELVATPVIASIDKLGLKDLYASEIDVSLSDTAAFCEAYDVGMNVSVNCVIVEAKRADRTWYAACLIVATDRIDINGVVRRALDAKKVSFASMDTAVQLTEMEYGGITPIGLPEDWVVLVDEKVVTMPHVVIGSGLRGAKLAVSGELLAGLPTARVIGIAK